MDPVPAWPSDRWRVPLSISFLFSSPIKTNLFLSPVGAFIVPLIDCNVLFGTFIVLGVEFFVTFLFKCGFVVPPAAPYAPPGVTTVTLTPTQLAQLMTAYMRGQSVSGQLGKLQTTGPLGGDEPLFPDNLSVSLTLAAPIADFDGSPDMNFNVPLFEVPGLQGGLIISLLILIARFLVELGGIACLDLSKPQPDAAEDKAMLNYLIQQLSGRRR
ncbi:MAG TPA: hypothetical protein VNU93_00740 [Verrucomicrobiae bacterium]|nr:hypothetical protein [Verrucomicrobiae bacterium]